MEKKNRKFANCSLLLFVLICVLLFFSACTPYEVNREKTEAEAESKENEKIANIDGTGGPLKGGGLIFTFDDGYETDYEVVYPILEEKGLKAVTYISPIFIEEVEGYMNWEQVKALDEAGWDVEDHTYSHANLTELTEVQIHEELQKVDGIFEARGLGIPNHHAFPHGEYNEKVKETVFSYRETARKAENSLNPFPINDDYKIIDAVDMGIHSLEVLEKLIDEAVKRDKLLVLFTHDVQEEPYDYGITTDKFKSVLEYALNKDINVFTLSELMEIESKENKE